MGGFRPACGRRVRRLDPEAYRISVSPLFATNGAWPWPCNEGERQDAPQRQSGRAAVRGMNAMTRAAKMLALMPVVALAAACNGVTPTSTTDLSRDLSADLSVAEGTATAMGARNKACAVVGAVALHVVDQDKRAVYVEAVYRYTEPVAQDCPAPVWTSRGGELQVDRTNPFRVAVLRTHDGAVTVQATAPNGVTDAITVSLGTPSSSDEPAEPAPNTPTGTNRPVPTNRPAPAPAPVGCQAINGVRVVVQDPGTATGNITLVASYSFATPRSECTLAPTWQASRKGLTVNPRDGFSASITKTDDVTVVYVTAPNGVATKVSF